MNSEKSENADDQDIKNKNVEKVEKKPQKKEGPKKRVNAKAQKQDKESQEKQDKLKKGRGNQDKKEIKNALAKNQFSEKDFLFLIEYMKQANKPFNSTTIESNLKAKTQLKKASLENALIQAVEQNLLTKKIYGSVQIYWYNQNLLEQVSKEEIQELTQKILNIQTSYSEDSQQLRNFNSQLTKILQEKTDAQLQGEIEKYTQLIQQQEEKIKFYQSSDFVQVNEIQVKEIEDKLNKCEQTYKQRKRICEDAVKELIDNNDDEQTKTIQEMFEIIGLDFE